MITKPRSQFLDHVLRLSRFGAFRRTATAFAALAVAGVALAHAPATADDTSTSRGKTEACSGVGLVWWNELLAPETEKLTDFYAKVVGWNVKIVDVEDQTHAPATANDAYTLFMAGDNEAAGLMRVNHPEAIHSSVGWFTYIQVADVDVAVAKTKANGGTILRQPSEVADGSRIAVVSDPMGNVFGLVTSAKKGAC
jgi:uncharacterized protein